MADEKKNPLIGAFRTPEPLKAPTATGAPPKTEEVKKPTEPSKASTDGKPAPATTPAKPGEEKKPAEPPKVSADGKSAPVVAPAKPGEEKKPAEPPKAPTDSKLAPATTPAKPGEEKKPAEPPKVSADGKSAPATTPAKPGEEKKPTELPKAPTDSKLAPDAAPPKPGEEKKPAEPSKDAEEDLPKNLKIPMAMDGATDRISALPLTDLHKFEGHPFNVHDDKDMWDLVESIKQFGVLEPAVAIPRKEGGYEMVSGHRRLRACELAGLTSMPVIIRQLDRDEATINMVDANLKRENISPMEKARAYDMKLEAMKRKAGRRSKADILTGEKPKTAVEELSDQTGESAASIKKIRNLVNLTPELQTMVEEKKLPVFTASDLASLKKEEQDKVADAIKREDKVPSGTQAAALKEASKAGTLTTEAIDKTVAPTKREETPPLKVSFAEDELRPYFPDKRTTIPEAKRVVFEALDLRARALERKAKQAAQEAAEKKKSAPVR